MADYTDPVREATRALTRFSKELVDQLDVENGSFLWWHGHTDDRRLVLIADYLIQSTSGVADALLDAALCAADHREALYSDNAWFRSVGQAVHSANPSATSEDYLRAFQRGSHEERRERRAASGATHTLIHLVQALDRLAAVLVIVSGVSTEALKVGWPAIERLAVEPDIKGKLFTAPLPAGVDAQRALLARSGAWSAHGSTDWLPWLLQTRHATAHRASTTSWNLTMVDARNRMTGMLHPFFAQPSRSEMHSLSAGPTVAGVGHSLRGLLVLEDSADVLDGLVVSTSDFVLDVMGGVEAMWQIRRDNPELVIQPGTQWKLDTTDELHFTGFGRPARIQATDQLSVGPELSKRLSAAKIMDADRPGFWG